MNVYASIGRNVNQISGNHVTAVLWWRMLHYACLHDHLNNVITPEIFYIHVIGPITAHVTQNWNWKLRSSECRWTAGNESTKFQGSLQEALAKTEELEHI